MNLCVSEAKWTLETRDGWCPLATVHWFLEEYYYKGSAFMLEPLTVNKVLDDSRQTKSKTGRRGG